MVRDRSSSWLDSFYSRSTPVIAGPKRMSAREKAKAIAWPFKTSLSGRLERKWEAAGNGPLLQWDRCRFSGLENEYPELVKIDAYHNDGCGTESCFRSTPRIPWLFTFYRWYIGFFSISRLSNRIVFKEKETSSAIFWHLHRFGDSSNFQIILFHIFSHEVHDTFQTTLFQVLFSYCITK